MLATNPSEETLMKSLSNETPSELVAVVRRLGSKDMQIQTKSAQTLREAGEEGLNALLSVWNEEEKKNKSLSAIMAGRMRRQLAVAMADFDDPRVLLPLAQSLPLLTIKSPEREKVLANLRRQLMREPNHMLTVPNSRYILRWVPERPRRQIRLFWFWLTCQIYFLPLVIIGEWFLPLLHGGFGGAIGITWIMPILLTLMAAVGLSDMKEDVTVERIPLCLRRRVLTFIGIGLIILIIGCMMHLLAGFPDWSQIWMGTVAVPVGILCSHVISKRAIVEPSPAPEINPEGVWPPAPRLPGPGHE